MGDQLRQRRESARPLPPPGSPNVLLVVMDTVAAGHLSLHGYGRDTSTTLVELADRGVRFDSARAACSWTLPSHATMFTGRWMHELSVGWRTPLDATHPTLAEFLGGRGYATAGFVGNTWYCATDSGLARGFTRYRDFSLRGLTAFKMAVLVSNALEGMQAIVYFTEDWLESAGLLSRIERLWRSLATDRKDAAEVNREFLGWLNSRPEPGRPFFAFLNYFDAHYPYQLPMGRLHRFGVEPGDDQQRALINHWRYVDKSTLSPKGVAFAVDAYDDCIADLDEQIGKLVDELERRGVLERTWLIITADHGESFGEHPGVFCHGTSLYETELHVPLLVIPPGRGTAKQVVKETVSLRDLAATIVDVAGVGPGAPFPGASLARFWKPASQTAATRSPPVSPALAEVVPNDPRNLDPWATSASRTAGSREGKRLVVHPPGGRRPGGTVPPERRPEGAARPRPRSFLRRDAPPDAGDAEHPHGWPAPARAVAPLTAAHFSIWTAASGKRNSPQVPKAGGWLLTSRRRRSLEWETACCKARSQ